MDAVAAADAEGVLVFKARAFSAASTRSRPASRNVGGAHQLDVQRGVQHVEEVMP
jgi:hypothetical protein